MGILCSPNADIKPVQFSVDVEIRLPSSGSTVFMDLGLLDDPSPDIPITCFLSPRLYFR
jgi:hypothetical protein